MKRIDLAAVVPAALAAALLIAATANFGPATFQLGLHNVTAAQALLEGREMCTTRGDAFTQWPPLFAWLLALGRRAGLDYANAVIAINAVSFAAVVATNWAMLVRVAGSRAAAGIAALASVVSTTLVTQMTQFGSEPLFLALALLASWFAVLDVERPRRASFAGLVACCALLCLQRYAGVAFVAAFALLLAWKSPAPRRVRRAIGFALLSAVPLALWMLRNKLLVGLATGERPEPELTALQNVSIAGHTLVAWWLGPSAGPGATYLASAAIALAIASAFALAPRNAERAPGSALAAYAIGPAVYLAFLLACASVISLDELGERLLLPVLPYAWGLASLGAVAIVRRAARVAPALGWPAAIAVAAALAAICGSNALATRNAIEIDRREGPGGFAARAYAESGAMQWLQTNAWSGARYSNFPEYVAFATHQPTRLVPRAGARRFLASASASDAPFLLVWIDPRSDPIARAEARGETLEFRFEALARFDGANVYRIDSDRNH